MAIRTRLTELLGIEHPIGLGGMGSIDAPALVAAASEAGALGAIGATSFSAEHIRSVHKEIRARTQKPYAANFLIFSTKPEVFDAALELRPPVVAFAWPRKDQPLKPWPRSRWCPWWPMPARMFR
jgi:NAD(P)H-dependent flavin oxidoreductase YrpB (nitropropane dioxygenase family)